MCAHHIVASGHPDAAGSRKMLYTWSIAINDADNGVFLPGKRGVEAPTRKDAVQYDDLHADERYYLLVERRLMLADQAVQQSGRNALREMRGEMVRGTFPVARG
ncbi:MAG: AHH domain-containing protein [Pseudomonadota bacterium]|nr:AHH domain-containing protein [Pseudomonadota bacterium]